MHDTFSILASVKFVSNFISLNKIHIVFSDRRGIYFYLISTRSPALGCWNHCTGKIKEYYKCFGYGLGMVWDFGDLSDYYIIIRNS